MYLYRAFDSFGDTVEFLFSEHRDLLAAKRFLRKAIGKPATDRSRRQLKIRIRQSRYLNNRIEQDHRRIKGRTRCMLASSRRRAPSLSCPALRWCI